MLNILISGVGGQGTLLASRVFGKYALLCGMDCKLSEIHGMSQRGGSVTTHVRMGEKVYSPVVWEGGADVILAFETLEAARVKHFLKDGGTLLVNEEKILPMPCITGAAKYPENLKETLLLDKGVRFVNARELAKQAGSEKATNVVMIGAACACCNMDKDKMEQAILACVPEKFKALNLQALRLGYQAAQDNE